MKQSQLVLCVIFLMLLPACNRQPAYRSAPVSERDVVIPVDSLQKEIPQFYTHHFEGRNISFFVLRLDHKVLSFLDACATCYPHKQGYRYEDHSVTCRYCNMRFSIYKLEKGLGGCYPIKIEGREDKGVYHIPLALLEAEAGKF